MRTIYLGLSHSRNHLKIGSTLIRWSEYAHEFLKPSTWFKLYHSSHVFALHPPHDLRPFEMINHSAGSMVHWLSGPNFKKLNIITRLYKFEVSLKQYHEIKNKADLQCGDRYPFAENAGIAWVRFVFWLTGKSLKNPFGSGAKMQKCSELILRNIILEFMTYKELCEGVESTFGYSLSSDIDNVGVRDMELIFEYCLQKGICSCPEEVSFV